MTRRSVAALAFGVLLLALEACTAGAPDREAAVAPNAAEVVPAEDEIQRTAPVTAIPVAKSGDFAELAKTSDDFAVDGVNLTDPFALPKPTPAYISVGLTVITVRSLTGKNICLPLNYISEAKSAWVSEDERFYGFEHLGYEAFGYTLFDRAGAGQVFQTGEKPKFSPSHARFAAVAFSDAGWGNFEGLGVWQVEDAQSVPVFMRKFVDGNNAYWVDASGQRIKPEAAFTMPFTDWRIDGWNDEATIKVSAISNNVLGEWPSDLPLTEQGMRTRFDRAPRVHWLVVEHDGKWTIRQIGKKAASKNG